ncbi:hypothetical protein, partial [Intrasporangium sp.]|uniref:hypothetical protein n=1 Tax=Intrasporangium sp. TaxID=1925024 RepID=UPI00293B630C
MTVTQRPAPARSDLGPAATPGSAGSRPFVAHGRVLTAGALAWAAAIGAFGPDPAKEALPLLLFGLGSGLLQVGLLLLLRVLDRTQALGTGRFARAVIRVETGLVGLAIASTVVDAIGVSDLTQPGWLLLDLFWPLSMLGMFLIGIRIAIAGRWRGASRFWPMVAESWAVVTIPVMGALG